MQNFVRLAGNLYDVMDGEQIIEDLIRLRKARKLSQRKLGAILAAAGLSTVRGAGAMVQKTETRERELQVDELFAWLHACDVSPVLWLAQYLSRDEQRVRERDRAIIRMVQQAIRIPGRRKVIEDFCAMWEADDAQPDTPR